MCILCTRWIFTTWIIFSHTTTDKHSRTSLQQFYCEEVRHRTLLLCHWIGLLRHQYYCKARLLQNCFNFLIPNLCICCWLSSSSDTLLCLFAMMKGKCWSGDLVSQSTLHVSTVSWQACSCVWSRTSRQHRRRPRFYKRNNDGHVSALLSSSRHRRSPA